MQPHHVEIVNLALDKLLNRNAHFSICAIDTLAETLGVNCKMHQEYRFLSTLHCIDYSAMSADLKQRLPGMIMSVLSGQFDTQVMAKALAAVSAGEIKDLPNTEDDKPTRTLTIFKR